MPKIRYAQVGPQVRRATHAETQQETAARQALEWARGRLQREESLPADAPSWAALLLERLRAVEILVQQRGG